MDNVKFSSFVCNQIFELQIFILLLLKISKNFYIFVKALKMSFYYPRSCILLIYVDSVYLSEFTIRKLTVRVPLKFNIC